MSHEVSGGLLAMFGVIALRLALSDAYLAYLKPAMQVPLVLTGAALVVLGIGTIWSSSGRRRAISDSVDPVAAHGDVDPGARRAPGTIGEPDGQHEQAGGPPTGDDDGGHGHHDHGRAPRVSWLVVLPVVALVLVAPAPLGAYSAERQAAQTPAPRVAFPDLPAPAGGAVDLSVSDFLQRAVWDPDRGLDGVPVRLTGFVVPDRRVDGAFLLTRFRLACCAADALPVSVRVLDVDGDIPPADTWLEVVGTWVVPPDGGYDFDAGPPTVELVPRSLTEVDAPVNPYE